jgi:hypothetical protein
VFAKLNGAIFVFCHFILSGGAAEAEGGEARADHSVHSSG